jgi:hypothetical protein
MVLWARYKTAQIRKEEDNSLKLVITQLMVWIGSSGWDFTCWNFNV